MEDFYRSRDAMNGGTSNPWSAEADFEPSGPADKAEDDPTPTDMRNGGAGQATFSGNLSQSELAS